MDIHYPSDWEGVETSASKISIIDPIVLEQLSFTDQSIIRPSGKVNALSFLGDDIFDAGSAGTVVHKIIEECWRNLDDANTQYKHGKKVMTILEMISTYDLIESATAIPIEDALREHHAEALFPSAQKKKKKGKKK